LQQEQRDLVYEVILTEDVLNDLQLLLGIRHSVLLRCVFECILTLFEWVERQNAINTANEEPLQPGKIDNLSFYFANSFTVDMLLQIIEGFSDDFRKLAAETLTYMVRVEGQTQDILRLFKELGGSEKLIQLMTQTESKTVRSRLLVCF